MSGLSPGELDQLLKKKPIGSDGGAVVHNPNANEPGVFIPGTATASSSIDFNRLPVRRDMPENSPQLIMDTKNHAEAVGAIPAFLTRILQNGDILNLSFEHRQHEEPEHVSLEVVEEAEPEVIRPSVATSNTLPVLRLNKGKLRDVDIPNETTYVLIGAIYNGMLANGRILLQQPMAVAPIDDENGRELWTPNVESLSLERPGLTIDGSRRPTMEDLMRESRCEPSRTQLIIEETFAGMNRLFEEHIKNNSSNPAPLIQSQLNLRNGSRVEFSMHRDHQSGNWELPDEFSIYNQIDNSLMVVEHIHNSEANPDEHIYSVRQISNVSRQSFMRSYSGAVEVVHNYSNIAKLNGSVGIMTWPQDHPAKNFHFIMVNGGSLKIEKTPGTESKGDENISASIEAGNIVVRNATELLITAPIDASQEIETQMEQILKALSDKGIKAIE